MANKTRNWLITLFILALPFLFFLGLLLFWTAEPLPPLAPPPNPNGYDDLVKAGQTVTGDPGDYNQMNEQQLSELVATNAGALQLLHAGLSNQCRVPLQFSKTYMANHLNDLAGFKRLAQLLAVEGRLAEMEGRPADAGRSYLDAIHLGAESPRGGVIIDQLVGTAIEAIGIAGLQKLAGQLDAQSCREIAGTLETLDAQTQTWSEVMQQERDWSRRTFPGIGNEIGRLVMHNTMKKALQGAQERYIRQLLKTRQLTVELAARAYKLDRGKPPTSVTDLVPDYLKAVPQDPITGTNMVFTPQ